MKSTYLSPELEIIEIKLTEDILSSSQEETIPIVTENTHPTGLTEEPFDPDF